MSLRVLIGCEFSGIVRDEFIRQGFDAVSCDLLPSESDFGPHIQGDIRDILDDGWDVLIAFPDCTFLCNSGVRWLYKGGKKDNGRDIDRWVDMLKAGEFFHQLLNAKIPYICLENPVPHGWSGLPDFSQSIQPWQFGHGEVKRTCFWLKHLPPLQPTNLVMGRKPRVHHASPGPDRWRERSRTLPGVAEAMAWQWGNYLKERWKI
jgi:hypothetical protein